MAGQFFGRETWNPGLIISQIILVQSLFYLTLGLILLVLAALFGTGTSLYYIFDYRETSFTTTGGVLLVAITLASYVISGVWLSLILSRAKKCLDFGATLVLYHICFTSFYSGFPLTVSWWITHILGLTTMVLLGEQLCMRREMREISVGGGARARTGSK